MYKAKALMYVRCIKQIKVKKPLLHLISVTDVVVTRFNWVYIPNLKKNIIYLWWDIRLTLTANKIGFDKDSIFCRVI